MGQVLGDVAHGGARRAVPEVEREARQTAEVVRRSITDKV